VRDAGNGKQKDRLPLAGCFSFAFLSKANEKKSILCALCVFAVKFKIIHRHRGQIIGRASVDYRLPYL
jgi:hypothetical protein